MGLALVAAFIGVPILEIAVFIQAGELLGLWPTLGVVVLTAIIGAALVRHQGFSTLMRAQRSLDAGQFPMVEVFDGFCLLLAGAFLLTPGFVTDSAGFLLLVPAFRGALRGWAMQRLVAAGRVHVQTGGPGPRDSGDGVVIDGDFEPVPDPEPDAPKSSDPSSPWQKPPARR